MASFVFVMPAGASEAQSARMMAELQATFPDHRFTHGDDHFSEYSTNIIVTMDDDGSAPSNPDEVRAVTDFFRSKIKELAGWKPS